MDVDALADLATRQLGRPNGNSRQYAEPLKNLGILRHFQRTSFEASLYEPVLCLILHGAKETVLGDETFSLGVGDCLLISHDLPVTARITKAPYVALLFDIDLDTLRSLYDELAESLPPPGGEAQALAVRRCGAPLLDAVGRYVALGGNPRDAAILGPLIAREIHYRLVTAPFGGMLRDLIRHDSHASAISRAIAQLRRDFRSAIEIPTLARSVGMSASSFHKHFKAITASSPLKYQKDLRLMEARRQLRAGTTSVSAAAYDVGYASAAQFSREYARKFGAPPRVDAMSQRSE